MINNISNRDLKRFNNSFCKEHNLQIKDIEKAKRIYKTEYEYNLELFKQGKLKLTLFNNNYKKDYEKKY